PGSGEAAVLVAGQRLAAAEQEVALAGSAAGHEAGCTTDADVGGEVIGVAAHVAGQQGPHVAISLEAAWLDGERSIPGEGIEAGRRSTELDRTSCQRAVVARDQRSGEVVPAADLCRIERLLVPGPGAVVALHAHPGGDAPCAVQPATREQLRTVREIRVRVVARGEQTGECVDCARHPFAPADVPQLVVVSGCS